RAPRSRLPQRQYEIDPEATTGSCAVAALGGAGEAGSETIANIAQAYSVAAGLSGGGFVASAAVILDGKMQAVGLAMGADRYGDGAAAPADAVFDRVLDQRLQDQARHRGARRLRRDLEAGEQ